MAIKKYLYSLNFYLMMLSLLFFITDISFSQITKPDSVHTKIDSLRIKDTQYLSLSTSDTVSYSKYIWSDKRDLSEILNEESGFFEHFMYRGGFNELTYNNSYDIGVFRDGVQVNLPFVAGFDNELFSVNEIDKIEILSNISSQLYGIGNQSKSVNIITKDVFNSQPFSQLRYSQDRFDSFDADFYISLPFSKKYKLDIGLDKYTVAGRYAGSAFDSWRGRGRFSYFPSAKANFKLNFNYASIDRNPYNGIKTNIGDFTRDSFIDSIKNTATILVDSLNQDPDYKLITTDLTANLKLFNNPENTSKIYAFYQKYSKDTIDEKDNALGISFTQKVNIIKNLWSSEFNINYTHIADNFDNRTAFNNIFQTYIKLDLTYRSLFLSGFAKYQAYFEHIYKILGFEGKAKLVDANNIKLNLLTGIAGGWVDNQKLIYSRNNGILQSWSPSPQYFEYGFELSIPNNKLIVKHFSRNFTEFKELFYNNFYNFNISFEGSAANFDYYINYDYYKEIEFNDNIINPVKANITYHDYFFNKHLNLHAGIDFKYFRSSLTNYYYSISNNSYDTETIERNNFLVDAFVGARIGHANINLTVANVFNNLVFDRYLFPYDNRGGLGNAISRFTIVWDFIN